MKRLVAFAGAGALFLSMASPAFAHFEWFQPLPKTTTTNTAYVDNSAEALSSTGSNVQWGGGFIQTGNAWSDANAVVVANTNVSKCTTCKSVVTTSNFAQVTNFGGAQSGTGDNHQTTIWGHPMTVTGNAGSSADAWTVVNTNLTW